MIHERHNSSQITPNTNGIIVDTFQNNINQINNLLTYS